MFALDNCASEKERKEKKQEKVKRKLSFICQSIRKEQRAFIVFFFFIYHRQSTIYSIDFYFLLLFFFVWGESIFVDQEALLSCQRLHAPTHAHTHTATPL